MIEPNTPPCSICGVPSIGFVRVEGRDTVFLKNACEAHMAQITDEGTLFNLEQEQAPQSATVMDPATNKQF